MGSNSSSRHAPFEASGSEDGKIDLGVLGTLRARCDKKDLDAFPGRINERLSKLEQPGVSDDTEEQLLLELRRLEHSDAQGSIVAPIEIAAFSVTLAVIGQLWREKFHLTPMWTLALLALSVIFVASVCLLIWAAEARTKGLHVSQAVREILEARGILDSSRAGIYVEEVHAETSSEILGESSYASGERRGGMTTTSFMVTVPVALRRKLAEAAFTLHSTEDEVVAEALRSYLDELLIESGDAEASSSVRKRPHPRS